MLLCVLLQIIIERCIVVYIPSNWHLNTNLVVLSGCLFTHSVKAFQKRVT